MDIISLLQEHTTTIINREVNFVLTASEKGDTMKKLWEAQSFQKCTNKEKQNLWNNQYFLFEKQLIIMLNGLVKDK